MSSKSCAVSVIAVLLTGFILLPLHGQDKNTGNAETAGFGSGLLADALGVPPPRASTEARIASWNPQTRKGLIAVHYTFPEGYHQIDSEDLFRLKAESRPGYIFGGTLKDRPVISDDGLAEYFEGTTLLMEFHASETAGVTDFQIQALFQICDENGICLFPDSELHGISFDPAGGAIKADQDALKILAANDPQNRDLTRNDSVSGNFAAPKAKTKQHLRSLVLFLLMAFAGGLLLNFMPCVLPVLSIKTLNLVKQAGQGKRAIFLHSWMYVAGIEVSFWILALIIVILQTSGRLLGWGFQFQSPNFVLILIAVIWLFSLSMFDVYVIGAPQRSLRNATAAGQRGGYGGSFLTGMFATLVATPCTAPLLGTALGFAFSQPPGVIFAVFSVIGLGLGLPFLLLGLHPALISRIPKPGPWMNTFRHLMGFLMAGTAVYLFTVYARLTPVFWGRSLWLLLILGFGAWLFGRVQGAGGGRKMFLTGLAVLLVFLGVGIWALRVPRTEAGPSPGVVESSTPGGGALTVAFDEDDLVRRLTANEPILLEFTAAWCTTCQLNKRVFENADVQKLMKDKGVIHVVGDLTAYDEVMTQWLSRFDRAGVPLYVIFPPEGKEWLLPELLSVDRLKKELEKLPPAGRQPGI